MEKQEQANYHHEKGWENETFKYRENTKEVLKERHTPSTMKEQVEPAEPAEPVETEEEYKIEKLPQ